MKVDMNKYLTSKWTFICPLLYNVHYEGGVIYDKKVYESYI